MRLARWIFAALVVPAIFVNACSESQVSSQRSPGVAVVYERKPARLHALEADDTYLYWAEGGGRVLMAPKSGAGPVTQLGTWYGGDVSKRIIAVDGAHVFWVEDRHINRWSKTDGSKAQVQLGDPGSGGWRIAEQGDFLYFTESRCVKFGRVPKLGGVPSFVEVPAQPDGLGAYIAVDESHVFCGHQSNLWMAPKEGGPAIPLAVVPEDHAVGPIASDGAHVYWANNRRALGTDQENLAMVSKAGGSVVDLGTVGSGAAVLRFDSSRNRLYWTTYGAGPADLVLSFSIPDKTLTKLAEKQNILGGMAQDDQYVYWCGETAIMRVPK